jgi:hypothetical protein
LNLGASINAFGQTVEYSSTAIDSDAVLVAIGEGVGPCAVLGSAWSDRDACGLNDSGDILGVGFYNDGVYSFATHARRHSGVSTRALASVWVARFPAPTVPKPCTWAMMGYRLCRACLAGAPPQAQSQYRGLDPIAPCELASEFRQIRADWA